MTYEEKLDEVLEWQKQQAEKDRRIKELEAQIEKMKCCGNCDWKVKGICNNNDNCELEDWKLVDTWR